MIILFLEIKYDCHKNFFTNDIIKSTSILLNSVLNGLDSIILLNIPS